MFTVEELYGYDKNTLVGIVVSLQEQVEKGKNITAYYGRKTSKSKYADVTPERVAELHLAGWSVAEIRDRLNKEFAENGVVDKHGEVVQISLQALMYKLKKYEKETGQDIYKVGHKGRKKKNPTIFD